MRLYSLCVVWWALWSPRLAYLWFLLRHPDDLDALRLPPVLPDLPPVAPVPQITIVLMDPHERRVHSVLTQPAVNRQRIMRRAHGTKPDTEYIQSRLDQDGRWIYRQVVR